MIHIVLVIYYEAYLPKIARVVSQFEKWGDVSSLRIVVNNAKVDDATVGNSFSGVKVPVSIIRHDNVGFEFGAYQRGIDAVIAAQGEDVNVLVLNDTVGTHQPINRLFIRNLRDSIKSKEVRRAVGVTDGVTRRLYVNGLHSVRWIRSNLLFMDAAALKSINYRIYAPDIDPLIVANAREDLFFSADVALSLRQHIGDWLFGRGPMTWYKAEPLSEHNCEKMAFKARCILQELYLSMRLETGDTHFIPPQPLKFWEKALVRTGLYKI
jgi:hypothetical protein